MFYLTTNSTHFCLRLYGVKRMVKDRRDSETGDPLRPPHGLLFSTERITHTTAFVAPVVERWLERAVVSNLKDRYDDPSHHE